MGLPLVAECALGGTLPWEMFLMPMASCAFLGGILVILNRRPGRPEIGTKEAFVLTALAWLVLPLFAGLPFYAALKIPFVDAWFEGVSALTATGTSLLVPEALSRPLWIWRLLLCFMGGVGMILMGMVIFPILRIGGMQLFRTESSEKTEKILPSVTQIAVWILGVYAGAMASCFVLLRLVGVSAAEALCHAISAVSTCGYSTQTASVAALHNPAAEVILMAGMIFGGSSLLLSIKAIKERRVLFLKDAQWRGYMKTLLVFGLVVSLLRWATGGGSVGQSVREGSFMTVSILTTTAFANSDYESWGSFAAVLFPFLGLIGGCTGSTSGGLKIFRLQVFLTCLRTHIQQLCRPHGVFTTHYNGQRMTESVQTSVLVFVLLYLGAIGGMTLGLALCHLDFAVAFTAAIGALGNVGLGMDTLAGGGALGTVPKMILMAGMVLGRLELLTILTLLTPAFWRK